MAGIFDFASNCTTTAELYNSLFVERLDTLALLQQIARADRKVAETFLSGQVQNTSFLRDIYVESAEHCRREICTSLTFTGNADIAGIGVSELTYWI